MSIVNKVAIVTGANRGIGKEILKNFVTCGITVIAICRQSDELFRSYCDELQRIAPGKVIKIIEMNLAEDASIKAAIKEILALDIPIDILVNNAGSIQVAPFFMTTKTSLEEMLQINFSGPIIFSQAISRAMVKKNIAGSIIFISSSAAIEGNEGRLAYASAKSALQAGAKVMARELALYKIRVNVVAPGLTNTDMMISSTKPSAIDKTLERVLLSRIAQPSEISSVISFLASDASSYINGQVLRVDGGML